MSGWTTTCLRQCNKLNGSKAIAFDSTLYWNHYTDSMAYKTPKEKERKKKLQDAFHVTGPLRMPNSDTAAHPAVVTDEQSSLFTSKLLHCR